MTTEASKDVGEPKQSRHKVYVLAAMLASAFVSGALTTVFYDDSGILEVVAGLFFAFLTVIWCVYDARERDFRFGVALKLAVFLVLIVGLPIYFFRTRGFRGFLPLAAAIAIATMLVLLDSFSQHLTLSLGDALGWWEYFPN